jgi:hypothetical protein
VIKAKNKARTTTAIKIGLIFRIMIAAIKTDDINVISAARTEDAEILVTGSCSLAFFWDYFYPINYYIIKIHKIPQTIYWRLNYMF